MTPLEPDLCVIGAGAGGLAVAAGAAQMGAAVVLIERARMGGDCLNFGCVPSKSLLAAAKAAHAWRRAAVMGISYAPPHIDFAAVADGVGDVIAQIAPNDSVERFEGLGVRVIRAEARFRDPLTAQAGDIRIRPRRFVIATGSEPIVPPIPGLDRVPFFTNETIFANRVRPDHLIVIGGGPVGIELAQAHSRLGARVTVLDAGPILPHDDRELVAMLTRHLADEGVVLRPSSVIAGVQPRADGIVVQLASREEMVGSHVLVATGRRPSLAALDLPAAGIKAGPNGIVVDRRLRTTNRRAYAIGDAAGGPQFTHAALHHAGIVIRNALFRLPAKTDYRALPRVTYTDPELAQVGLTAAAAAQSGGGARILRWSLTENDRAHTEHDTLGEVKIVVGRRGRILGATVLAAGAGDLILPWTLAISEKLKIAAMANLIVPYPTRGEAGKRAAGSYYTPALFSPRTRRLVHLLARLG